MGDGKNKKGKCFISHPCSGSPNDAIFTKLETVVDLTYIPISAKFGCYRFKCGHSAVVQNIPFPYDFNGWPYNKHALTCFCDVVVQSLLTLI